MYFLIGRKVSCTFQHPGEGMGLVHCSASKTKLAFFKTTEHIVVLLNDSVKVAEPEFEWPLGSLLTFSLQVIHGNTLLCFTEGEHHYFQQQQELQGTRNTHVWGHGTNFHDHKLNMQRTNPLKYKLKNVWTALFTTGERFTGSRSEISFHIQCQTSKIY